MMTFTPKPETIAKNKRIQEVYGAKFKDMAKTLRYPGEMETHINYCRGEKMAEIYSDDWHVCRYLLLNGHKPLPDTGEIGMKFRIPLKRAVGHDLRSRPSS